VTPTTGQLAVIVLGDAASSWSAAGFRVDGDEVVLGSTRLVLTGTGQPLRSWGFVGVEAAIDGLEPVPAAPAPDTAGGHPNGITRIDHVVVRTGDCDRTVMAFEEAGFEVRGGRSTTSYGAPMRQVFFWAGDVILELIGPDRGEPTSGEATSIFGLALEAADLERTAEHLGELLGTQKDAVQPGRRIAGLRGSKVGISLPIAVMSPHVRARDVRAGGSEPTGG
jgi:hypothetical protein